MEPYLLETRGPMRILRLSGSVTIEHARALHGLLQEAVPGCKTMLLDFKRVTHLDVSILQLLLAASREVPVVRIEGTEGEWMSQLSRFGLDRDQFEHASTERPCHV